MFTYRIPSILPQELEEYHSLIKDYEKGKIGKVEFRSKRVPMGVYEQRKDGTYMIRVRCAGAFITPKQFKGLAEISAQFNVPYVHITTRQEIQIHNVLELEHTYEISKKLLEVGLASRGGGGNTIRNIMTDLESGISNDDVFDVTPYSIALTNKLISEPDSWNLPRKFKISFSSSPKDRGYACFNDLGFIAKEKNGKKGFKVYIGGGLAVKPMVGKILFDFMPEEELFYVAKALKLMFNKYGNRRNKHKARLRFLFYKLGKDKVAELFNETYKQLKKEENLDYSIEEPQFVKPNVTLTPLHKDSTEFKTWKEQYVKEQRQKGLYSIMVPFLHGNISPAIVIKFAHFLEAFGSDVIRFSMRQNIQLRNIPEEYLGNLYQLLVELKLEISKSFLINSLVSCTGADTCRLGICLPKGAIAELNNVLGNSDLDYDLLKDFRINLSGCPNSCGQHRSANLGFFGKVGRKDRMYPEYNIVVGGEHNENNAKLAVNRGTISAKDLPNFTLELLKDYSSKKEQHATFNEYLDQGGNNKIDQLAAKYNPQIPTWTENNQYYYDWGSNTPFSIAGRSKGECSAGIFDMIDVDMDAIKKYKEELGRVKDTESTHKLLEKIVFSTSRMLLVTRGIDPKTENDVYNGFVNSFIDDDLVPIKYKNIIEGVQNHTIGDLSQKTDEIFELSRIVIELYESMNDSLQFPKSEKTDNKDNVTTTLKKDYRGVACPMNFVKTKLDLATLQKDDVLEILLDDGDPIDNVPGSVKSEGHKILKQERIENYWSVVIKKN